MFSAPILWQHLLTNTNDSSNYTLPPRNSDVWSNCDSFPTGPPLVVCPTTSRGKQVAEAHPPRSAICKEGHCQAPKLPHVDVIRTTFDWKHVVNQTFSAKTDRKENAVWTEVERVKAEAGEVVEDMNDLHDKVCELKLCIATDLLTSCLR